LKDVVKPLSKKFASSASIVDSIPTGKEINIQGDVMFEVAEYLVDTYKIEQKVIYFVEKGIKKKAF